MFCFQCEQTAGGKVCAGKAGVCGKNSATALLQDQLTGALISLAKAAVESGKEPWKGKDSLRSNRLIMAGLFATLTNVNFNDGELSRLIDEVHAERAKISGSGGEDFTLAMLWQAQDDIRSLKSLLLFGLRGIAAYAFHADKANFTDAGVFDFFYKALPALAQANYGMAELLPLVMEAGTVNLAVMALLDTANTAIGGQPVPTTVDLRIEKGPFIVVSGHDFYELKRLLEEARHEAVSIYTHGEMLPAHAYPKLKAFPQLKGHLGTGWQNQEQDFDALPAPILFTSNCLMPPKNSYADRVFTIGPVSYPGTVHIQDSFKKLFDKASELGGYTKTQLRKGLNGGSALTVGFARNTVLGAAETVVNAVKAGAIKHFFLVGGCDGAKPERSYFTDFVKAAPKDTIILTLGCGKYRFNDLDLGEIGGLPRIMDMGQCNDAYSAIQVAIALADAFKCGVNELPLTLVLSWYEQKAVSILLTLLSLGIKNIYLGPSLPAFVSPGVLQYLVANFNITPTSTPQADLAKILGK
ncbi:hydroxylamine reductase [Breznakiellaceae bacterium SP9]